MGRSWRCVGIGTTHLSDFLRVQRKLKKLESEVSNSMW
jgi:hypothetical protein